MKNWSKSGLKKQKKIVWRLKSSTRYRSGDLLQLKALLISRNIEPPRTHSLETLLDLIVDKIPELEQCRDMLTDLTPYSVEYRYPGVAATPEDAEYCVGTIRELRKAFKGMIKS